MNRTAPYLCGIFVFPLFLGSAWAQEDEDRVQFGKDLVVGAGETVADVVCIGCSVRVDGTVNGDAVALGGSIEIEGSVAGDAVVLGGGLHLGPAARVGADAVALGGPVERHEQSVVGGEVVAVPGPFGLGTLGLGTILIFAAVLCILANFVFVTLAFLVAGRQRVEVVGANVSSHPGLALLAGLVVCASTVALFVFSSFLGPLTPVVVLAVLAVFLLTLLLGYTGLSFRIGKILLPESAPLLAVLIGTLLITVLHLIPFLNFLVVPVAVLLALGSAASSGFGNSPEWLAQRLR